MAGTLWTSLRIVASVLALASFAYCAVALVAAYRFFERGTPVGAVSDGSAPPLSLLKPIYGLDRETYENYASFCQQDYSDYEILFCVSDDRDAAIPVIEKLIRDYPDHSIRLLIGSEPLGVSDKVNKLCRMAREAKYDLLVVTDSDVRVEPGFLRAVAAPFNAGVGGVTCLYRGFTDGSLAANLEAMGNSTDFAAGVLVAWLFAPMNFMLGAVMATTKDRLAEIGGFEALVNYFCDDYELGNRIAAKGHHVELVSYPVSIVYPHQTLAEAFRHQLRWNLSIRFSRPLGHLGLLFTQALPLAVMAALFATRFTIAASFIGTYLVLRYAMAFAIGSDGMRDDLISRKFWLLPVRDAFAFAVWVASFFPQTILWRGKRFYVRDKRLVPAEK